MNNYKSFSHLQAVFFGRKVHDFFLLGVWHMGTKGQTLDFRSKFSALLKQINCKIIGLEMWVHPRFFRNDLWVQPVSISVFISLIFAVWKDIRLSSGAQTGYNGTAVDGNSKAIYSKWRRAKSVTKLPVECLRLNLMISKHISLQSSQNSSSVDWIPKSPSRCNSYGTSCQHKFSVGLSNGSIFQLMTRRYFHTTSALILVVCRVCTSPIPLV